LNVIADFSVMHQLKIRIKVYAVTDIIHFFI
jgi:hypothetical protein